RHTREASDWSSDVCSSDLAAEQEAVAVLIPEAGVRLLSVRRQANDAGAAHRRVEVVERGVPADIDVRPVVAAGPFEVAVVEAEEIGRASWRGRVSVARGSS